MACPRIQKTWRQIPYFYGEGQWLKKREAALAGGLPRIGLILRLASLVAESQAKSAKAIQLADPPSGFQLKHRRPHQSFLKKKRKSLSGKRQAQRKLSTSISAKSVANVLPWHRDLLKTNAELLLSMRATQKLARKRLLTTRSITQHPNAENTELSFQESEGLGESQARVAMI